MVRRYDSFVLRWWRVSDEQRIEVEHLQSGGRTRAESLGTALSWIDIQCGQSAECAFGASPAEDRTEGVMQSDDLAAGNGSLG
jgi:hypothetical protein